MINAEQPNYQKFNVSAFVITKAIAAQIEKCKNSLSK